ncbi:MAG TPA: 4'-phosphopantetheinyl transferase superfamily protein [Solirubrobacteraceae bacterium]|nr:4'-phosphopantetheinyl transferase superfamily protein [Solirubrobacteraceae bacterium]
MATGQTSVATSRDLRTVRLSLVRFSSHERSQWLARSAALLNGPELERVAAIIDPDTRAQHAIGRALVRLLGAEAIGCSPLDVTVAVTETGKPWLLELPDLHVNVSHTRRTVVVASALVAPVGVDIEHPAATAVHPQRLAQRLFACSELRTLRELSEDSLAEWFASVWTIKEAVGKALGIGVVPALSQVVVETRDKGLELASVGEGRPAESWTLHQLTAPGGGEKIAVAVQAPGVELEPVSVVTLDWFVRAAEGHRATARR